tara:strand:- start:6467 stop:7132 length:666 start_codon:yes stop_codon:yes gene_type:complete
MTTLWVKEIDWAEGAKGQYMKITDQDGKTHNIFETAMQSVFMQANAGQLALEVGWRQNGKYWNIISAELMGDIIPDTSPQPTESKSSPPKRDTSTNHSIEEQTAFKGVIELMAKDKIDLDHDLSIAALQWARDRLEKSLPSLVEEAKKLGAEPMVTPAQLKRIKDLMDETGWGKEDIIGHCKVQGWDVARSTELTEKQAAHVIETLKNHLKEEELEDGSPF